ncbi:MAG: vitamin K epoxide reductase family protein [FCB group bacterium]|nr:vitamin K epoxide reductase family protein [FCB group bacterium]
MASSLFVILLIVPALIGWWSSLYFYLVHKEVISAEVSWMLKFLRMTDCRCDEIVDTKFGRTFGKSNAYWGLWYYLILIALVAGYQLYGIPTIEFLFIVALLVFAYSVYLAWGLYILKVLCRPCLTVHVINLLIFVVLLFKVWPLLFVA